MHPSSPDFDYLDRPHICNVCERRFALKGNLEVHRRIHLGIKPYECDICFKAFTNKTNLDSHRRTHTGERPFVCTVCAKAFSLKGNLVKHEMIHSRCDPPRSKSKYQDDGHRCYLCSKIFISNTALDTHIRRQHSDTEDGLNLTDLIQCQICNAVFNNFEMLQKHVGVHGEKHRCIVCLKPFSTRDELDEHVQSHLDGGSMNTSYEPSMEPAVGTTSYMIIGDLEAQRELPSTSRVEEDRDSDPMIIKL